VLQCVSQCVLQCVLQCMLQCIAECRSVSQCIAMCVAECCSGAQLVEILKCQLDPNLIIHSDCRADFGEFLFQLRVKTELKQHALRVWRLLVRAEELMRCSYSRCVC